MSGAADILATVVLAVGGLWIVWKAGRVLYNLAVIAAVLIGEVGRAVVGAAGFAFAVWSGYQAVWGGGIDIAQAVCAVILLMLPLWFEKVNELEFERSQRRTFG